MVAVLLPVAVGVAVPDALEDTVPVVVRVAVPVPDCVAVGDTAEAACEAVMVPL